MRVRVLPLLSGAICFSKCQRKKVPGFTDGPCTVKVARMFVPEQQGMRIREGTEVWGSEAFRALISRTYSL